MPRAVNRIAISAMKTNIIGNRRAVRAEARDHADHHHDQTLHHRHRRTAQRAPDHDQQPGTGATSISFRNPNCRSKISSIPEKIDVNRIVIPITPGARN